MMATIPSFPLLATASTLGGRRESVFIMWLMYLSRKSSMIGVSAWM